MPGPESPEHTRLLGALMLGALVVALLGSLGFLHPAVQDFPYSWF